MRLEQRIEAFVRLGTLLGQAAEGQAPGELALAVQRASQANAWFTEENIRLALRGIASMLQREALERWLSAYTLQDSPREPKHVAVIMAGNIPLVGFHDMLAVLITGHRLIAKPSSQDSALPEAVLAALQAIEPGFAQAISLADGKLSGFTHVIATGSDNSSRYFEYYFSRFPHIIRHSRQSVAVVTGQETDEQLSGLGKDIFRYFGLGCRSVSKLYLHRDADIERVLRSLQVWEHIAHHHKYCNNYEYHKAVMLVERIPHLDNGFLLLREHDDLACPVGVLHYERFDSIGTLQAQLAALGDRLQCIVADGGAGIPGAIPFGQSQCPMPWDYADGVDTVAWLAG